MGWCSGSEIYIAAAKNLMGSGNLIPESWKAFAEALQEQDWDCEDDALDSLTKGTLPWEGLMLAMGKNPNCQGKCSEVSCEGKDYCGCVCHY